MNTIVNVSILIYFGLYLLEIHFKLFMMAEICLKIVLGVDRGKMAVVVLGSLLLGPGDKYSIFENFHNTK